MTVEEFKKLKNRVFDFFFTNSYKISGLGNMYFSKILDESYSFVDFKEMKKYVDEVKLDDITSMFKEKFLDKENNLKVTAYVSISHN